LIVCLNITATPQPENARRVKEKEAAKGWKGEGRSAKSLGVPSSRASSFELPNYLGRYWRPQDSPCPRVESSDAVRDSRVISLEQWLRIVVLIIPAAMYEGR
jgi:hypothetical protein